MPSEPYRGSHGYLLDYDGFERIPPVAIIVDSTNMALVPSSAYAHPGDKYDHTLGPNPMALRSTHLPSSVAELVSYADQYLDARPFAAIPNYARAKKNSQEDSWYNNSLHLPADARTVARCRALVAPDMPFVCCGEESDYQWRVKKLLEDLYSMQDAPKAPFPPPGHSLLGLVCFRPPYDRLYWLSNRNYWNDMIELNGRIRTNLKYFFCWHQVEFHDMPPSRRPSLYLMLPSLSAGPEAAIWHVSTLLMVPTPSVVPYHTYQLQGDFTKRLPWLTWQVLFAKWAVFCLMDLLDTARYVVQANVREADCSIWNERVLPSPEGRLVPLPRPLIRLIRELRVQNIVRGMEYESEEAEALLDYVLQVDWAQTPGFLWYDYDTETFFPIPRHPIGNDDGNVYQAKPLLAVPGNEPRQSVPDYYPQAIGFHEDCLRPLVQEQAIVPVPAPSVAPSFVPAHEVAMEEPPEASIGLLASPPPTSMTVSTPVVPPLPPMPVIPEVITMAFDDLKKVCTSVGILETTGIVEAIRSAQSWARRASRYHSLVQRNQEVKEALATILEDNSKVLSERVATDLDNRFGLNLSDTESAGGASFSSTRSPAPKRARPGSPSEPAASF